MIFLRKRKDLQSGQAIVLIALAFVGLAAFIGLATDTGILFSSVGSLRRAVDAATLAASNQFREGQTAIELQNNIEASARQFMKINLPQYDPILDPPDSPCEPGEKEKYPDCIITVRVYTCEGENEGPVPFCREGSPQKLVRVEAKMRVDFAFLRIVGWEWAVIRANAISQAASVDLVLVLDTSPSMSYDLCNDGWDNDEDGTPDDCSSNNPPNNTGPANLGGNNSESDILQCIANRSLPDDDPGVDDPGLPPDGDREDDCHPFEEVRTDAKELVRGMHFPYDRVAIVGFSSTAEEILFLEKECEQDDPVAREGCILLVIDDPKRLNVELEPTAADCPNWEALGDPSGCTSTNTGDALLKAGNLFFSQGREHGIWVVVLLSDGVANAALSGDGTWVCPSITWDQPPYCQDGDPGPPLATPREDSNPEFDADDHARRMALFVGCDVDEVSYGTGPCTALGNGATVFTICLGVACVNGDRGGDHPDVGGELLQFIAAAGDGVPGDPCPPDVGTDEECENYYFVPNVSELDRVFKEIASRIYTKLNH